MKKVFTILATAAALISFNACDRNEIDGIDNSKTTFVFTSEKPTLQDENGTKTGWNGTSVQWLKGDNIRMAFKVDDVWQSSGKTYDDGGTDSSIRIYASKALDADAQIANFIVPTDFQGSYTGNKFEFFGLYPTKAVSNTAANNAPILTVSIPAEQTPKAGTFDSTADLMVGSAEVLTGMPTEAIPMMWNRVVALADITLKGLAITEGENPKTVTFTAQEGADLVGSHSLDLIEGTVSDPKGVNNVITINASALEIVDGNLEVWLGMLPATVTSLSVVVETDKATYTRDITGINLAFKQNKRNLLGIDMSKATREEIAVAPKSYPYTETFEKESEDFTIDNKELGGLTYVWKWNSYKYMKASAHDGSAHAAESWLISPYVDMTGAVNPGLTFEHTSKFFTNIQTETAILVREGEGEWKTLTIDAYPTNVDWNFVKATASLKDYVGKTIQIAFKYTSTSSAAGTWEVKNVSIDELPGSEPTIEVEDVTIPAAGVENATITPTVTNMDECEVEIFGDAELSQECDWVYDVSVDPTTAAMTYSAQANTETTPRTAYVVFHLTGLADETLDHTLKITQEGAVPAGLVNVDSQSYTFSELGYDNAQEVSTVTGNNCSILFDKGTNSNAPKYYNSGAAIRVYGGGTVSVKAAEGYKVSTIELTFGSGDGTNDITASTGTYANGKWTGDATEVVFTVGGTSGNRRIAGIKIN
ncbi:MAG: choice-of-anchor J domain-containing protein [Bacteroidales bacterium]|nr:choice-of-anchor J domain-containing protein [Bacteroidales bacterium]